MNFTGICIISKDVKRLREFYETLLQIQGEGDDVFVRFDSGNAVLSIFDYESMERMASGSMQGAGYGGYTIELQVDNVDQQLERLNPMNYEVVKPPTTQPWGRRSVWLRDPDGNIINLYTNVQVEK